MPQVAAATTAAKFADIHAARARNGELAQQLRSAAMDGDEARIARLLAELLRCKGLSRGQRIALQQKALLNLVRSLRSAALNDDVTGLFNRRGFVQVGTRLLDLASRDEQVAHLIYFEIADLEKITTSFGASAAEILVRGTGNLLRDLFPSYGVYEVLGRLRTDQFVALTTREEHASRAAVMLRVRRLQRDSDPPTLILNVGVAHFNPARPAGIDELLESAKRAIDEPVSRIALSDCVSVPA